MKVSMKGNAWPVALQVMVGSWCARVPLWWEFPPKISYSKRIGWAAIVARGREVEGEALARGPYHNGRTRAVSTKI